MLFRILKEALRGGGSNITPQHIEDLSLCGLFFMEVVKQIDHQFEAHHTSAHTTLSACKDINKLACYLTDKGVVHCDEKRDSPSFVNPTDAGLSKLCNTSWITDTLNRVETDDNLEREDVYGIIDGNYELGDVG